MPDPDMALDLVHTTVAPPFPGRRTKRDIVAFAERAVEVISLQPKLKLIRSFDDLDDLLESYEAGGRSTNSIYETIGS